MTPGSVPTYCLHTPVGYAALRSRSRSRQSHFSAGHVPGLIRHRRYFLAAYIARLAPCTSGQQPQSDRPRLLKELHFLVEWSHRSANDSRKAWKGLFTVPCLRAWSVWSQARHTSSIGPKFGSGQGKGQSSMFTRFREVSDFQEVGENKRKGERVTRRSPFKIKTRWAEWMGYRV